MTVDYTSHDDELDADVENPDADGLAQLLVEALDALVTGDSDDVVAALEPLRGVLDSVFTAEGAGLLAGDNTLVLRMGDGAEFQVTCVRSR